ncbi:MAG: hypothetical protein ACRD10_10275, partial [Terriglobia bacterium]
MDADAEQFWTTGHPHPSTSNRGASVVGAVGFRGRAAGVAGCGGREGFERQGVANGGDQAAAIELFHHALKSGLMGSGFEIHGWSGG